MTNEIDHHVWSGEQVQHHEGVMRTVHAVDRDTCMALLEERCDYENPEWEENPHSDDVWNVINGTTTLVVKEVPVYK